MTVVRKISDHRDYKQQEAKPSVDKGFALFHRKIMDCGFYKDSQAVHLWFHLVMKATHKPIVANTEFGDFQLDRGQFITGRHKLASETGILPDRIQYLLRKFVSMEMISTVSNRKFTVISILKYDEYQADYLPTDYQQITNANPHGTKAAVMVVPTDSQQITTYNELNTNNSISNDIECPSQTADQDDDEEIRIPRQPANPAKPKAIRTPYEDMVNAYHEILPEMSAIEIIRGKRKSAMRNFWQQCNREYQKAKGVPFTIANWRNYLEYIATNCTWMMQERPNGKGGFWAAKNLDYLVSDECYTKVKEQRANDRK